MPEVRLDGRLCLTHNPDYSPGQGQATSYYNPIGPEPGIGYVWMLESDVLTLDFNEPQALSIEATESITLPRLWIDSAVAASGISPTDQQRAYLLTLRDSRFILARQTDVNVGFNCRPGAAPTLSTLALDPNEFYVSTLNPLDFEPFEWNDAVGFLWSLCPALLVGAYTGLPYQPEGVPQDLRYIGVSAWHALHELLGRIKLTTAYNAALDQYTIVDLGEPQPSLQVLGGYAARILNDRFPGGSVATRIPGAIRTYFTKRAQHFGTEPDTPRVSNWQDFGEQYWQDVPTGVPGAVPGTVVSLHDDAPAMIDYFGSPTNLAELTARANDRAANWVSARLLEVARGSLIIQGIAAPLATPGSQVSGVLLRNFGDGWMTELALTPNQEALGVGRWASGENFAPPDLGRRTWPGYPRVSQLVKVTSAQKDGNGLCVGVVLRANPAANFSSSAQGAAYAQLEPCLVAAANGETLTANKTYLARLNGTAFSSSAGNVPLYITSPPGSSPVLGKTTAAIANNSFSGKPAGYTSAKNVQIYSVPKQDEDGNPGKQGQETQQGSIIAAFNKFFGFVPKNTWVWCQDDGDGYYIVAVIQGDHLVGLVVPTAAQISGSPNLQSAALHAPNGAPGTWTEIDVQLQSAEPADQSLLEIDGDAPTIKAAVRFWPVIDGEQVALAWTGSIFTVIASDFQGGMSVLNTAATITKGNPFPDGTLREYNTSKLLVDLNDLIGTPYGDFPANKWGRIAWNHYGGEAIAAEC